MNTDFDVVSIIISYDSQRAICVQKANDEHYIITQYDLDNQEKTFEENFKGNYIKMAEVEQNSKGNLYHVVYMDDGVWKLRVFGQKERSLEE